MKRDNADSSLQTCLHGRPTWRRSPTALVKKAATPSEGGDGGHREDVVVGGVFAGVRCGSFSNHGSVRFETWRTDRVVDAGGRSSPMRPLHTSATVTRRSRPPRALSNMHHAPTAGVEMSLICSLRADNPLWTPEREILHRPRQRRPFTRGKSIA